VTTPSIQLARSPDDVLAELDALRAADAPTHGGRLLAYVYDPGLRQLDELAAAAAARVQALNGLDPTAFSSVAAMERDLVALARDVLAGGDPDVVGSVTSGGTESCLLAVKAARDAWRARHPGAAGGLRPVLLVAATAHPAFRKAAAYLDLELRVLPVAAESCAVRAEDVSAVLADAADDVALVVVSAPSYPHGVLDPVEAVAAACAAAGVACHVDACIGGWILPFLDDVPEPFDLSVPGVTSLSVDLH
jgi:glutamate/tyrosine decarboxylase-like PLP-dependent enzyme